MKLKELLPPDGVKVYGDPETEITGVSYDSRTVKKGDIFFALPGQRTDGKKYAEDAVARGAAAVVSEAEDKNLNAAQIAVKDVFAFMAELCAKFYGHPDREMTVIGITGTNGKTTITYMIESILANAGIESGVIGTVNYRYAGKVFDAPNTTPQSADVYRMLREMSDSGVKYAVMETSSHALALGRVAGIDFDIAVFTNLTQDHLDFHKSIDKYFEAKTTLFTGLGTGTKTNIKYAIINADDKYGKKLSKININAEKKLYGVTSSGPLDFAAENTEIKSSGSSFDIVYGGIRQKIDIRHIGMHNVYNALAALASCVCSGMDFIKACEGLNNSAQAPGRLERVDTKDAGF